MTKIHPSVRRAVLERTRRLRKLCEYIDARSFMNATEFREYKEVHPLIKRAFPRLTHNQRLILILNYHFGWGKDTIVRRVKISYYGFYQVKEALRTYDSIVMPVPSREL